MKSHFRKLISFLPANAERKYYQQFFAKEHEQWTVSGKPLPVSNLSKHEALRAFQQKYQLKTLVETGTYMGDTLYAVAHDFDKLYSIELSEHFHQKAKKRFKKYRHIHLIQGDSGKMLSQLVPQLKEAALFWLDGHYSGGLTAKGDKECPVYEELQSIFASPYPHIVFIDDARLFVGKNDYPAIEDLKNFVMKHKPGYHFSIENDCIRLVP